LCHLRGQPQALHKLSGHNSDSRRFVAIGIAGVWNWRGTIGKATGPKGERLDEKGPIPDWDQIHWEKRDVYVCFDADWQSNPAVWAARRELFKSLKDRKANARAFDVPEGIGVDKVDDWIVSLGPDAVLDAWRRVTETPAELPGKFVIIDGWVCHVDNNGEVVRVCSELRVLKEARVHGSDEWWKYLCFKSPDGTEHRKLLPFVLLDKGDGSEYREFLSTLGLRIGTHKNSRALLTRYLKESQGNGIVHATNRTGWHDNCKQFVLPDESFSTMAGTEAVIFQSNGEHRFRVSGTLKDWQDNVAKPCIGNSRLILGISTAFAATLLGITNGDSGGIHIVGPSSTGKTRFLYVAGSVWGGGGNNGFAQSWRTTGNGLEAIAQLHNDSLLCLDELSQIDPKAADQAAYLLGNGSGKNRMTKTIEARKSLHWKVLFLSTGERTLAEHASTAGKAWVSTMTWVYREICIAAWR
jgi:hypothetical protein